MESFERLFVHSYARGDGSRPAIGPQVSALHTNALLSWALLLTICTASQIREVLRKYELAPYLPPSLKPDSFLPPLANDPFSFFKVKYYTTRCDSD